MRSNVPPSKTERNRGATVKDMIRINKYLSQHGICSRREADRMLDAGEVTVNGKPVCKGIMVSDSDHVCVRGVPVGASPAEIVIAFHKPAGIVCTSSRKDKAETIIDYIDFPERIYPVGRLDKQSTGLILLTNNGQLTDDILRGSNCHEKEYVVTLDREMPLSVCQAMEQGVPILDTITRPCVITNKSGRSFHITITQGLNRQIRRMCEYFGYRVRRLKRIRIMNIELGDLEEGRWRYLTERELSVLKEECRRKGSMENKTEME